jgi:fructokinase
MGSGKLIAIGEYLIDFTATKPGMIKSVSSFDMNPGGAPANVAVCVKRLGRDARVITKLGSDPFGDFLIDILKKEGIDTSSILRDSKHHTPLAFVSLTDDGERDFVFLRKDSSDLFLSPQDIDDSLFETNDIFHFGSVDLVDAPVRNAHRRAIEYANSKNMLISFDPNLRFPLWPSVDDLIQTVNEFIPFAHILKVSEEELPLIEREPDEQKAVTKLFKGNVSLIIVTRGSKGSAIFSKQGSIEVPGIKVKVLDTTGAGDSFIRAFLYLLLEHGKTIETINDDFADYATYLSFANRVASKVCTRKGAIPAMPYHSELDI